MRQAVQREPILTDILYDVFTRFQLLRGQCFDGASNMWGSVNGIRIRIQQMQPIKHGMGIVSRCH
jgi:hypothetical protein